MHRVLKMKVMKKVFAIAAMALGACSQEPANLYECRMQAAKLPTEAGVVLANRECNIKFKSEFDERRTQ